MVASPPAQAGVRQNTLSSHLNKLSQAGLVSSRREGRSVICRADFEVLGTLLLYLVEDCCMGNARVCEPLAAAIHC